MQYYNDIMTDSTDDYNPDNPYNQKYDKFFWQLAGKNGKIPPEYEAKINFKKRRNNKNSLENLIFKKIPTNGLTV